MKSRFVLILVVFILLMSAAACGKATPQVSLPEKTAPTVPLSTAKPAPTSVPPTAVPPAQPAGPKMDVAQRSDPGGFEIETIPGYTVMSDSGTTMLVAPDGDPSRGPAVLAAGMVEPALEGMSIADVAVMLAGDMAFTQTEPTDVTTVSGVKGVTKDLLGIAENDGTKGKLAVLMPTPTQVVMLMAVAPIERWGELEPYFNAMLASIKTFAPVAAALPTPAPAASLSLPDGYEQYLQVTLLGKMEPVMALLGQPTQTLKEHAYRGQMLQSSLYRFRYANSTIEVVANASGDVVSKTYKSLVSGSLPAPAKLEQVQPGMSLSAVEDILGSGYLLTQFVDAKDTTQQYSVYAWPGSGDGQLAVMFLADAVVKKVYDQPGIEPAPDADTTMPRIPLMLSAATNSYTTSVLGNAEYNKYLTIPLDATLDQVKAVFGEPTSQSESPASAAIKSITYAYTGASGELTFKIKVPDAAVVLLPDKDNLLISKTISHLNEVSNLRKRHVMQVKKGMTLSEIETILGGPGRIGELRYNDAGKVLTVYAWTGTQYSTTVKAVFVEGNPNTIQINSSASDDRYELDCLYEDYIFILPGN